MTKSDYAPCPMFNDNCRFCSTEHQYIPYNQLRENPNTKRLEPSSNTMIRKEPIGEWCNNVSRWVRELQYCPARWGLVGSINRLVGCARVDGCGVYSDNYGQSLIPREDEFVVQGVGQQVLF